MRLIELGQHRIGFWMADRTAPPAEIEGPPPRIEGVPSPGGATLVLGAIDRAGEPVWSMRIHEPDGAALVLTWRDRLIVGLGASLLFIDEEGNVRSRYRPGDEWVAAWPIEAGLLLIGRWGVHLLQSEGQPSWQWSYAADGVHFLGEESGRVRLAEMHGDDWRDVSIDAATGQPIAE